MRSRWTAQAPASFTAKRRRTPGQWDLIIDLSRDGERVFRSRSRVTLR